MKFILRKKLVLLKDILIFIQNKLFIIIFIFKNIFTR